MQNFGIYIIGDEILSGKRADQHLAQAIQILKTRGLTLSWAQYLGDDLAGLTEKFAQSFATTDIVFSFGGIGATPDDYTRQAAAAALNLPIERHAGAIAEIEAQFGEAAYPKRVLMADFPRGADLIPNPVNRVAGFAIYNHYFLPGFPQMAWPMMEWVLDTHYRNLFHQYVVAEAAILVHDAGESQLIDLMNAIVQNHPQTKLFSLPKLGPNKTIELGVKGSPEAVNAAMAEIQSGVSAAGFPWQKV
jgi:molybdopterin-biosynthesis enzyme MoeA-like protein